MYILADGIVFTVGRPASRRGASCGLRPPPPGSTVSSLPILSSTSSKRVSPQPPAFVIHAQGCTARDPEDPPIDPGLARMPAQRRMPALDRDHVRRHRGGGEMAWSRQETQRLRHAPAQPRTHHPDL